jgi:hypothetical protein
LLVRHFRDGRLLWGRPRGPPWIKHAVDTGESLFYEKVFDFDAGEADGRETAVELEFRLLAVFLENLRNGVYMS